MKLGAALLESKKAGALLVASVMAVFGPAIGIPEAQVGDVVNLAMAYIIGQGVADVGVHLANGKAPPAA